MQSNLIHFPEPYQNYEKQAGFIDFWVNVKGRVANLIENSTTIPGKKIQNRFQIPLKIIQCTCKTLLKIMLSCKSTKWQPNH